MPPVPRFVEETDTAGFNSRFDGEAEYLVGGGVATFDCDADGLPEIYVTAGVNKAKLYRNKSARGGAIKLMEERSGLELTNAIGAYPIDIDGDGNADLVVLRVGEVQLFRGLGGCRFERANDKWKFTSSNAWHSAFAATWERGQAVADAGHRHLCRSRQARIPVGQLHAGRPVAPGRGRGRRLRTGHAADARPLRAVDAVLRLEPQRRAGAACQQRPRVLQGRAGAVVEARARRGARRSYTPEQGWKPLQIWGMGIASADLDGDGYPEVFLTSMSDNKLQQLEAGAARPSYRDIAFKRGATAHRPYIGGDVHPSTAWHAQFADVNHDGLADLFIVKGNISAMPDFAAQDPNNLLLQRADGTFAEAGQLANVASFRARPRRHAGRPERRRPARHAGGQPLGQGATVAQRRCRQRRAAEADGPLAATAPAPARRQPRRHRRLGRGRSR